SLRHATGDWVLIMDADERVPADFDDNLRSLLIPTDRPLSYLIYIRNYLHEGDESTVLGHYMVRLFRKTPETRFFGTIHEQLYPNWGEVTIPENSFYLNHLGYSKQDKKQQKIDKRNLPMIQKALDETRGKNPSLYSFYAFYMGSSVQNVSEVRQWLKEAIEVCPEPERAAHIPVAYLDYMRAIFYSREYDFGIGVGKEALSRIPNIENYPDFWDFFGILYLANQQHEEAINAFERAIKLVQDQSSSAMFFASHTSRIGGWGTLLNLGLAHALKGDQAMSETHFRQAMDLYPGDDKSKIAERVQEIMGNPQLIQGYFEDRLKAEPSSFDVKVLSNIYLKSEMPFEAILLQHDFHGPDKAIETALQLAQTYEQHQRLDLAIKTYEGILSLKPEHVSVRLSKYGAELQLKQQAPTADSLEELAVACQNSQDWQAYGAFCLRFGLLDLAEEAFTKVLAEQPKDYDANLYLALVEQENQAYDAAIKRLQDLIARAPDQAPAQTQLGNLYLFMGQFSDAETQFRHVLKCLSTPDWYSHYGLGVALAGQERFDEAESELQQALTLVPNHPTPSNLLALIQQARQSAEQP
ncbi:MAG: hypothetical protein CVV27_08930, partial [Candidatus Melainabacteria bacterium HGW-Melainabacteria-1]